MSTLFYIILQIWIYEQRTMQWHIIAMKGVLKHHTCLLYHTADLNLRIKDNTMAYHICEGSIETSYLPYSYSYIILQNWIYEHRTIKCHIIFVRGILKHHTCLVQNDPFSILQDIHAPIFVQAKRYISHLERSFDFIFI